MDREILKSIGVDVEAFEAYAKGCPSVYSFPSVAVGVTCEVHCQMRGEHKRHKAIYHGFPYEWEE